MTHRELIAEMARRLGLSPSKVSDLLDATVCELNKKLSENTRIIIPHFGVFETRKRSEHISVNPQTQQRYLVPPSIVVTFKPASGIKEQLETVLPNVSGTESEAFLKALFELIPETLSEDETVKIENFGTFKLVPLQARESVDVNSGEKIEVPAHNRLSFFPAAALKELVNKPFSHFESILLNEGVVFEGVEEVVEEEEGKTELTEEKPAVKTEPYPEVFRPDRTASANARKRSKIPPVWIPVLGGVAIALAGLFFFIRWQAGTRPATITENPPVKDSLHHFTAPVAEKIQELPERLEKVVVQEGKTLRLIAEEKFGNREFWVYIYLKNKDKMKNPNLVAVGTELIIPDASEYDIDASDTLSIAKAKALGDDFL